MREIKITPYGTEETMIGQETCPPRDTARDAAKNEVFHFLRTHGADLSEIQQIVDCIWNAATAHTRREAEETIARLTATLSYAKRHINGMVVANLSRDVNEIALEEIDKLEKGK